MPARRLLPLIISLTIACMAGAMTLPEPTNKLVNDFAHIFTSEQVVSMEARLEAFSDSTSNQICIVTIADLQGTDASDYAIRLGEKWGVGSYNKQVQDNGVIILLKPRNEYGGGDVFIATGYGVEGVLPDATCKMLIEKVMIPLLKEERYFEACDAVVSQMMPILQGEYDFSKEDTKPIFDDDTDFSLAYIVLIVIAILCIILLIPSKKRRLCSAISSSSTPEELEKNIAAARAHKVKDKDIENARNKVSGHMLTLLEESSSPAEFASIAKNAIAMGVAITAITALELQMPEKAISSLQTSSSHSQINHNQTRARAFGCSEEAIAAATAIAMAALLAATRRRSGYYSTGFGSGSHSSGMGGGFGGFGGGHFGGGGAGGKF